MADFTSVVVLTESPDATGQDEPPAVILDAGVIPVTSFPQRIYDTGVGDWVYYTLTVKTPSPTPTQTTPNHTNNLVADTHETY